MISSFAFNFRLRLYATVARRAVRPYVVKLTTPMPSALGARGLASTSTLGNVHLQLAQGGRASPKHSSQPDCCKYCPIVPAHTHCIHAEPLLSTCIIWNFTLLSLNPL
jgi:hypothetical protein